MTFELENYHSRIDDLRNKVAAALKGLNTEGLNWRPLPEKDDHEMNSLAVLAAHIAGSEHFWIAEVVGGAPATRVRSAEFETVAANEGDLLALLERSAQETHVVLSGLKDGALDETRQVEGRAVPFRWALLHLVEHMALHLGHMQITRQLWQGGKALPYPTWRDRPL